MGGCATSLTKEQEREYGAFKRDGVLIEEKSPGLGAALGILPGGGSFYAGEAGIGIINLLFWPISILWDPISGYDGSKAINYDATKYELRKKREAALTSLDQQKISGSISSEEYEIKAKQIEEKHNYGLSLSNSHEDSSKFSIGSRDSLRSTR